MSEDKLRRFVSNFLHETQGASEDTSVDYLIARAKAATTANDIISELSLCGISTNDQSNQFAQSLFKQVPRLHEERTKLKRQKQKEYHQKVMEIEKNKSYKLISFDDSDHDTDSPKKAKKKSKHKHKKDRKHKFVKKRDREHKNTHSHHHDIDEPSRKKRKMTRTEEEELKRLKDQREKQEFEARMRKKDLKRKQKLTEEQLDRLEEDRRRKALQFGDTAQMNRARIISERQYKKKRAEQQLYLYEQRVRDEEDYFGNDALTTKEQEQRVISKKILNIAHEAIANRKDERDGYYIPSAYDRTEEGLLDKKARANVMKGRYREEEDMDTSGHYRHEQEKWEASRIRDALGDVDNEKNHNLVSDPWAKKAEKERDQYDKVDMGEMEEIDFIMETLKEGKDLEKELKEQIEEEDNKKLRTKEARKLSLQEFRKTLPVYKFREELLNAFEAHQIMIIVAATGSGKTTQIPQYIYEERDRFLGGDENTLKIGVTQPRRVAAMSVATRVSQEMDCRVGSTVGYAVRFEDKTTPDTVIKYMTDGMLLRELLLDGTLSSYGVIMIDEAHERTLHTDILFGLLKDMCRSRKDLKLLISSATLEASKFCDFFDNAPQFKVPGRSFQIDTYYLKAPEANYVEAVCISVLQFHVTQALGDILVFLTGQEEIDLCKQSLEQRTRKLGKRIKELIILPIYANLPAEQQIRIFEPTPPNARKVVLATNIAETSLTIDNILYVIDPGFNKQNNYSPRTGMDSLVVTPISKASAEQRAGRAGRTAPGKCFRLYTKDAYMSQMEEMTIPEIQRTNLGNVVLLLKSLGINDLIHFDFMDAPPAETLMRALELLYGLGALNNHGELTMLGRKMAEFPVDPQLSKCLCESPKYKCCKEMLTIASMLSANHQVYYIPKEQDVAAETLHRNFYKLPGGDHYTLLNIYNQWRDDTNYSKNWCEQNFLQFRALNRARDIREQLENLCERVEIDPNVSVYEEYGTKNGDMDESEVNVNEYIGQTLTAGYFFHTAKITNSGQYKTIRFNEEVQIHPSSSLSKSELLPRWVLFHELVLTSSEFMRNVIEIEPIWITNVAPHFYKKGDVEKAQAKMPKNPVKNQRTKPNGHQY
eukprot:352450_1